MSLNLHLESFNYIIRSTNKTLAGDSHASCSIRLQCPSLFKYYECEIVGFYLGYTGTKTDVYTSGFLELRSDNFTFVDFGSDTGNKRVVAVQTTSNFYNQQIQKFKVANFNGVTINFSIVGDDGLPLSYLAAGVGQPVAYNKPWILILNMKGSNE